MSVACFNPRMRTRLQMAADRSVAAARRAAGENLRHLREDAGLSRSAVAVVAGIDRTYLTEVEDGDPGVSLDVLGRVAAALGADLSLRVFPNTGPAIRDRFQAPMIEALLRAISPGWDRHLEVRVNRPVRGVIDLVLAIVSRGQIVAVEAHSELRRLEQQLRWAAEKTEALPSAAVWPALTRAGVVVAAPARVLLLRSTPTTRRLATEFAATLDAAYPAPPTEVFAALTDPTRSWPGNGLLWARVEGGQATILSGGPRGLRPIAR